MEFIVLINQEATFPGRLYQPSTIKSHAVAQSHAADQSHAAAQSRAADQSHVAAQSHAAHLASQYNIPK